MLSTPSSSSTSTPLDPLHTQAKGEEGCRLGPAGGWRAGCSPEAPPPAPSAVTAGGISRGGWGLSPPGSIFSHKDWVPSRPPSGLSQEAEGARTPRVRTASTAQQVSALVCSFRHRRYRGPLLAREMQLSEVQARGVARCCPAHLVSESLRETQTPSAGLAAERALPHSTPCAPGALTPHPLPWAVCGLQLLCPWASLPGPPALAQPLGSFWGPCRAEPASLASAWASCGRQPPRRREPGAHAEPSFALGSLARVRPAGDPGCLLRMCGCPEARS